MKERPSRVREEATSASPPDAAATETANETDVSHPPHCFYVMAEMPCPYLPGRWERKVIAELPERRSRQLYDSLILGGFRRSHRYVYRPACTDCEACVPVRVAADRFVEKPWQRRVLRRNADVTISQRPAIATDEQYRLFKAYFQDRHDDGEMSGMSFADYRAMVEETNIETRVLEFRAPDNRLLAACLVDWVRDGVSAVYSFFAPGEPRRSLGSLMILELINQVRGRGLAHVYLGYWIAESAKMRYKTRFEPLEGIRDGRWCDLSFQYNGTSNLAGGCGDA